MSDEPQFAEAELARVADGSLEAAHEAEVRRRLEGSPELATALREQERAVAMMRSIGVEVPAPASARAAWMQQIRGAEHKPRWRLRRGLGFAVPATVAAAVALAIVLVTGGGATGPTLQQTVRVTLAAATYPAPSERDASTLRATAAGIAFPYWQHTVGWRAVGARTDRIGGRAIETVFYSRWPGSRVGYAIVGGPGLAVHGGQNVVRGGVPYRLLHQGSATLVTWLRDGHTCVIAGRGVSEATLLALATADAGSHPA